MMKKTHVRAVECPNGNYAIQVKKLGIWWTVEVVEHGPPGVKMRLARMVKPNIIYPEG